MGFDFSSVGGVPVNPTPDAAPSNAFDFSSVGGVAVPSASDAQLKQALGNFDDMQKLSPKDQAKAYAMQKKDSEENSNAIGVGLSKGAFMPVELANKLMPGESVKNLREKLISGTERAIANTIGDDKTQELYNNISDEDLVKRNASEDQAIVNKAPVAAGLGEAVGSLPATMLAGGAVGTAAKAASAGMSPVASALTKAGVNIAGNSAIGEGMGIAKSDADTLEQRAKDALPSAAVAGLISTGAEGLGLAANPTIQDEFLNPAAESIKDKAARFSAKSLKLTPTQLAKLDASGQTEALGRRMLDEGITTPFASLDSKAAKLAALKEQAGKGIDEAASALDEQAGKALAQTDNASEKARVLREYLSKKGMAGAVEKQTLDPLNAIGDPNNHGFRVKELLSKIEQTGSNPVAVADEAAATAAQTPASAEEFVPSGPNADKFIGRIPSAPEGDGIAVNAPVLSKTDKYIPDAMVKSSQEGFSQPIPELGNASAAYSTPVNADIIPVEKVGNLAPAEAALPPSADDILSFKNINGMKQNARQGINYKTDSSASAQNIKNFTREMNDEMLARAAKTERALNSTEQAGQSDLGATPLTDKLVQSNKDYGMLSTGAKAASQSAAKAEVARDSATPAATGLGYLLKGPLGALEGATVGLAKKAVSTYGNNVTAVGLDKLANVLQTAPQALGEYAPILQKAASRGQAALAAANFTLNLRSPEYRDMTGKLDSKDQSLEFTNPSIVTPGK